MKQLISLVSFLVAACIAQSGAPPRQQAHVLDATISHPVHLPYPLFLPSTYAVTPDTHWPLILYLHGGSLRGEDLGRYALLDCRTNWKVNQIFPSWLFRRSVLLAKFGCTQRRSTRYWIA